jgi:hypothetical protein
MVREDIYQPHLVQRFIVSVFDPTSVFTELVVDKVSLRQVFIRVLWFPPLSIFHHYSLLIHLYVTEAI